MKKIYKLLIMTFIILFISIPNTKASDTTCKGQTKLDLSKEAANVKASYEEVEETITLEHSNIEGHYDEPGYITKVRFDVIFYNITENLQIEVTNKKTNKQYTITYGDTDNGTYKISHTDLLYVTEYSYKVIGSISTPCRTTTLKTGKVTVPARNPYSEDPACEGYEDFYACQEYVNYDTATTDSGLLLEEHIEELQQEKQENEKKQKEKFTSKLKKFLKQHKTLLIIIGSVLFIIALTYIIIKIIIRRKRII